MKLKRNAILVLCFGILFLLAGTVARLIYWKNHGTVGIIGGADIPTYRFSLLTLSNNRLSHFLQIAGTDLIVSAGFCLLFSKTVRAHCSIATSALSLAASAVGAFALICVYVRMTANETSAYSVCILLAVLCLIAFLGLVAFYIKKRVYKWSVKGLIIDALTGANFGPTFFFVFSCLRTFFA